MSIEHLTPEASRKPPGTDPNVRRRTFVAAAAAALATPVLAQSSEKENTQMAKLEYINPEGMHKNPAFSQGIIIPAGARTLIIGGQNAVNAKGEVVGKGDIAAQTTQAVDNLIKVLEAAGGKLENLVRVGLLIRQDADVKAGFGAWMARAGKLKHPPTVTAAMVAGLATPDYLIEIEATAILL
jgi:enamine deaminase RidA (YjgF/YER057c/UK114 family)